MSERVFGLSIWQPYASLIALGHKRFETREWKTVYRGKIAIHASVNGTSVQNICQIMRAKPHGELAILYRKLFNHIDGTETAIRALPRGAIIATARLAGCYRTEDLKPTHEERIVGNFSEGRFAWLLEDVVMLPRPITYRGDKGLFKVEGVQL